MDITGGTLITSLDLSGAKATNLTAHSNSNGTVTLVAALDSSNFKYWVVSDLGGSVEFTEIKNISTSGNTASYVKVINL